MAYNLAQEEELHSRYQEIVSRRAALAAAARKQQELEDMLMTIPVDADGLERNASIKEQCNIASSPQRTIDAYNPLLKRHEKLKQAYDDMVQSEQVEWKKKLKKFKSQGR